MSKRFVSPIAEIHIRNDTCTFISNTNEKRGAQIPRVFVFFVYYVFDVFAVCCPCCFCCRWRGRLQRGRNMFQPASSTSWRICCKYARNAYAKYRQCKNNIDDSRVNWNELWQVDLQLEEWNIRSCLTIFPRISRDSCVVSCVTEFPFFCHGDTRSTHSVQLCKTFAKLWLMLFLFSFWIWGIIVLFWYMRGVMLLVFCVFFVRYVDVSVAADGTRTSDWILLSE